MVAPLVMKALCESIYEKVLLPLKKLILNSVKEIDIDFVSEYNSYQDQVSKMIVIEEKIESKDIEDEWF